MKFAKYTFYVAGILGLIILLPQYFLESKTGQDYPPAITHPEYFYGFIGVAVAFQFVFLIIARHPGKYRLLMIPSMIEKFSFSIAVIILYLQNRIPLAMFAAGLLDLTFGILFVISFFTTSADS
jgi:hypothetical protein